MLDLQFPRQVDNQLQVVERVLVDGPNAVVDEKRTEKQGKQEYLRVVVFIFVERADTFTIDEQGFQGLPVVDRL